MTDTQWPRFMVFQQEAAGKPFVHNGTVHAPDIEMAMQNARDVFVRRPEAAALWVVPADLIYTQTREQLAGHAPDEVDLVGESELYYVFGKFSEQAQCRHIGKVNAQSAQGAIRKALANYEQENPIWWWAFPVSAVLKSEPGDADAMFAPARDKTFKDQAEYPVVTLMRKIRAKGQLRNDE